MLDARSRLRGLEQRLRDEVVRIAADEQADVVTVFVYEETTAHFHLPTGYGLRDPQTFEDRRLLPRSGRVAGMVARERREIIAERVRGHSPMDGPFARREGIRSAAGYPLIVGDRTVGVLFLSYRNAHSFGTSQRARIGDEARSLAILIDAEAPWHELSRLDAPGQASDDPNLRAIDDAVGRDLAVACRRRDSGTRRWYGPDLPLPGRGAGAGRGW
jgi:GAF domain-containing protein